ncbi:MAG: IS66 family insertion sequence element accessory protein TnpB [Byssovorax sp.]
MIGLPHAVRVWVHRNPADMRKSFDTLAAVVREGMGTDVLEGGLFVFVGRRRCTAKVLYRDGTGHVVLAKRLSQGRFVAPWQRAGAGSLQWTMSELALFLEGSEIVGRVPLSPPPWRAEDRRIVFR